MSSCNSLLGLTFYQRVFTITSICVLLCNLFHWCFLGRRILRSTLKSNCNVFQTHLAASDFIMGIHLAIVTAADQTYRSTYLWEDTRWRHSTACQMSGFFHVLSTDMSACFKCLMTLDRCVALRCPHSHARVGTMATQAGCAVVWAGCVLLAAVPLMSGTSHWQLYSQTGVCQPLVSLLKGATNHHYTLAAVVGLTLTLHLVTCVAHLYLATLVSEQSDILTALKTSLEESSELPAIHRVSVMLLFDTVCWSCLCLVMVLTTAGVSISTNVQLASATCVLPLKAALNPVMYLAGCLRKRQRDAQWQRLFQRLGVRKNVWLFIHVRQ